MITFRQKGDFSKLTRFLERAKETVHLGDLDSMAEPEWPLLRLQRLLTLEKRLNRGITRSRTRRVL